MRILGLIPARGGSKGIPGKNIKKLAGKPLIQYTIENALKSKMLSHCILSTDDKTIADIGRELGVSVPFLRPETLAADTSGSLEVILHALRFMEEKGDTYDAVCLLQPTSPFRQANLIDDCIRKFSFSGADSLVSVRQVPHEYNPHWTFFNDNGYLRIATGESEVVKRRQDLPDAFYRDGAVYLTLSQTLFKENSLYGKKTAFLLNNHPLHVNLDTPDDWLKAENKIIKYLKS